MDSTRLKTTLKKMSTARDVKEALVQEADFWRTMLQECLDSGESETQRMHDALMLVEYKPAQMTDSCQ